MITVAERRVYQTRSEDIHLTMISDFNKPARAQSDQTERKVVFVFPLAGAASRRSSSAPTTRFNLSRASALIRSVRARTRNRNSLGVS